MYQVTSRGPARIRCGSHRGRRVSLPSGSRGTYTSSGTDAATLVTIFVETKIAVSTCTCSRPSAAAYVALLTTVEELLQRRRARMPWPLGLGRTTLKARSRHACRFSTRTLVMPSSGGPVNPAEMVGAGAASGGSAGSTTMLCESISIRVIAAREPSPARQRRHARGCRCPCSQRGGEARACRQRWRR